MLLRSRWTALAASSAALCIGALGIVAAPGTAGAAHSSHAAQKKTTFYLSLGDSYSQGYQTPSDDGGPGYTDAVARKVRMTLVNFGCGGATTASLLDTVGCPGSQEPVHGVPYPDTTQEAAALDFIAAYPGQVGLITVSISGNDVTSCASAANAVDCVLAASTAIKANVGQLVSDLDAALAAHGDSSARIVGLTYPDVILGNDVVPIGSPDPTLADLSVVAFDDIINPSLQTIYDGAQNGSFVDVTSAPYVEGRINAPTGDDSDTWDATTGTFTGPTTKFLPWGTAVPENVAEVCYLTYYCTSSNTYDIHPNTHGYRFISSLIESDLGV